MTIIKGNISNGKSFIMYYDIISSNGIITREQSDPDRSPEFCCKRIIYRNLLETGHVPGDLPCGPCSVQES